MPSTVGDSRPGRLTASRADMAEDEGFSHLTAARPYGIPLPRDLADSPAAHVSVGA